MKSHSLTFPSGDTTEYHFDASFGDLMRIAPPEQTIIITDDTVAGLHGDMFGDYRLLTFPAGEQRCEVGSVRHGRSIISVSSGGPSARRGLATGTPPVIVVLANSPYRTRLTPDQL